MLDESNTDEKIMIVELFRNLGNYVECRNVLKTINEKNISRQREYY
jgi:hypothetical protein